MRLAPRTTSLRLALAGSAAAIGLMGAPALAAPAATGPTLSTGAVGNALAVTFYLGLRNPAAAEAEARSLQTPGSADYHRFLTLAQFLATYAPTAAQLAQAQANIRAMGYTITATYANRLAIEAVAPPTVVQSSLGVGLRRLSARGRTGLRPDRAPTIPARLRGLVTAIAGLDTFDRPHPHLARIPASLPAASHPHLAAGALNPSGPGDYLPADFERFYDVTPLYTLGATGAGRTIGIVTLADFSVSDDFAFWTALGLHVSPTRVTKVSVDNGVGTPAAGDGEGETDLDTEESGAIAPGANLRVYVAPATTTANFINAFEAAASDNIADTVSTSWGESEIDEFEGGNAAAAADFGAFHSVFLEMALQGQTIYAASGDSGAYDTVDECPNSDIDGPPSATTPICNAPFSVDFPASDPLVTAAGGTTLPFSAPFTLANGATVTFSNPTERAWSWDYVAAEAAAQGQGAALPVDAVFSTGGGGGVSSYWATPWYQAGVPGIGQTKPGQYLSEDTGSGPSILVTLPASFAGRNTPDISANADPFSGYQYISEGAVVDGYGGTSFVAPQLNGVTALFGQLLGNRVGAVSPALYALGNPTFPDVTAGNNWGYEAVPGYDAASGVGRLDAGQLLATLHAIGFF